MATKKPKAIAKRMIQFLKLKGSIGYSVPDNKHETIQLQAALLNHKNVFVENGDLDLSQDNDWKKQVAQLIASQFEPPEKVIPLLVNHRNNE